MPLFFFDVLSDEPSTDLTGAVFDTEQDAMVEAYQRARALARRASDGQSPTSVGCLELIDSSGRTLSVITFEEALVSDESWKRLAPMTRK